MNEAEKKRNAELKYQRRLEILESKLEVVKNTPYRYALAKENAIKRLETEIKNLKEFQQNG